MAIENITSPVDGQAYVDLELMLPSGPVQFASGATRFVAANIKETVYGYGETNITVRALTTDYADRILKSLEASGTPVVRFRFGIGVPDRMLWTPWQVHIVVDYRGFFEGVGETAGHSINLHTLDILALFDRSSRLASHRGKVSAIVQKLAEQNGLENVVIEETNIEGLWIQSFEGDFEFARKRLVRVARSTSGHGNYLLFIRDNVLHFHTPDYQADVKELNYYKSSGDKLELFSLNQQKIDGGAAGVRMLGHDPYTGESREALSSRDDAVRFSNWVPRLDQIPGADRKFAFHLSENRGQEALNIVQNTYEAAHIETYQVKMKAAKLKPLRPGNLLNLAIEPKAASSSTWSGLWLVTQAEHVIESGVLKSVYIFNRGELTALKSVSNALAQNDQLVQDEQNAPGHDINLQEANVSQLTKGAGQAVGAGVYATVQDASKAVVPKVKLPQ